MHIKDSLVKDMLDQLCRDEEKIQKLVNYINRMIEGDEVFPELTEDMFKWGYWDKDGFQIE